MPYDCSLRKQRYSGGATPQHANPHNSPAGESHPRTRPPEPAEGSQRTPIPPRGPPVANEVTGQAFKEMTKPGERETLIFVHIPKTAGSTLNFLLDAHYTAENSYATSQTWLHPDGSLDGFDALTEAERAQIELLNGHMGFGLHRRLPQPARYVTVLRDPVARVLSHYHFECTVPGPLHDVLHSGEMDLLGYLDYQQAAGLDNLQTRMIAGNWHKKGYGPCTPAMLETAKQNLRDHFLAAGLTARFDQFYWLLKRKLGWPTTFYVRHNRSSGRPRQQDLPDETVRLIAENNRFDVELVHFAARRFQEEVQAQGTSFFIGFILFQSLNNLYRTYWELRKFSLRERVRRWRHRSDQAPAAGQDSDRPLLREAS